MQRKRVGRGVPVGGVFAADYDPERVAAARSDLPAAPRLARVLDRRLPPVRDRDERERLLWYEEQPLPRRDVTARRALDHTCLGAADRFRVRRGCERTRGTRPHKEREVAESSRDKRRLPDAFAASYAWALSRPRHAAATSMAARCWHELRTQSDPALSAAPTATRGGMPTRRSSGMFTARGGGSGGCGVGTEKGVS